jgi:hypothetical protein
MPLILAIEPDRRQAAQIKSIAHILKAELVLADSAVAALKAIADRVPDLILTPALFSPRDEAVLNERLRALERAAQFVQTLTIPMLAAPAARDRGRSMLSVLRREKATHTIADGCDPTVFANQCREYLERSATEREHHAYAAERESVQAALRASQEASAAVAPPPTRGEPPIFGEPLHTDSWGSEPSGLAEPVQTRVEPEWREPPFQAVPEVPVVPAAQVMAAVVHDQPPARVTDERVILLPESETEVVAPEPEPRAVVIRAEFPSPQSQNTKQGWRPAENSASHQHDELPGPDEVMMELTHQAEPPEVIREVATAPEATIASEIEEDLGIFDLNIDALVNESAREQASLEANVAAPQADGRAGAATEMDDLASDDADLEVYDLDLSSLLGERTRETASVVEATPASPIAESVELGNADNRAPVATAAKAAASHGDNHVNVYDLDMELNLAIEQLVAPPAPKPTALPAPPTSDQLRDREAPDALAPEPRPTESATFEAGVLREPAPPIGSVTSRGLAVEPKSLPVESKAQGVESKRPVVESKGAAVEEGPTRREIEEDARHAIKSGLWAPLLTGAHQLWPRLEGGIAQHQQRKPPKMAEMSPAEAPVATVLPTRAPTGPKRPEWLNALKALTPDGEPPWSPPADSPVPLGKPPVPARTEATRLAAPEPSPVASMPTQEPAQVAKPTEHAGQSRPTRAHFRKKAKNEQQAHNPVSDWGFFDPGGGGFSALVTRLDELTSADRP